MDTENVTKEPAMSSWKVRALGGLSVAAASVAPALAAVDINESVGPILDSVIALIPTIIELIVAIVPAVIVLAVVGFIVAFFDRILAMMKI